MHAAPHVFTQCLQLLLSQDFTLPDLLQPVVKIQAHDSRSLGPRQENRTIVEQFIYFVYHTAFGMA